MPKKTSQNSSKWHVGCSRSCLNHRSPRRIAALDGFELLSGCGAVIWLLSVDSIVFLVGGRGKLRVGIFKSYKMELNVGMCINFGCLNVGYGGTIMVMFHINSFGSYPADKTRNIDWLIQAGDLWNPNGDRSFYIPSVLCCLPTAIRSSFAQNVKVPVLLCFADVYLALLSPLYFYNFPVARIMTLRCFTRKTKCLGTKNHQWGMAATAALLTQKGRLRRDLQCHTWRAGRGWIITSCTTNGGLKAVRCTNIYIYI